VALSDPLQILASPLQTILRTSDERALLEIAGLVDRHGVEKLIIGGWFAGARQVSAGREVIVSYGGPEIKSDEEAVRPAEGQNRCGGGGGDIAVLPGRIQVNR